jgi:putative FmdB family regulatory protein
MPIYEYRRPDGTTFEVRQSFSEDALTVDPDTGVPVERVLHAPAVHFKGKGFYNTDYGTRNRQRETAAAAEGKSGESSAKDSSAKDSSSGESSSSSSASSSSSSSGDSSSSSSSSDKGKGDKGSASGAKPAKPASSKDG